MLLDSTKKPMYYEAWADRRASSKLKLNNVDILKRFETLLNSLEVEAIHIDNYPENHPTLYYSEGSANFELFKLTPRGEYIVRNPGLHLWKSHDIDSGIIDRLNGLSNTKYLQSQSQFNAETPYNLFLLQMASTIDLVPTLDAVKYATEQKRYTLFKTHPAVGDGTDFESLWSMFEKHGIISDYTVLVDADLMTLIRGAEVVYSADSACTFNALLEGKPVYNYRSNEFSDIVPLIKSSKNLPANAIDRDDVLRFLSWYYHSLSIDFNDEKASTEKILRISNMYKEGKDLPEMFG
jgi:hypothetical protein